MKVKDCKFDGTLYIYDRRYIVRFVKFSPELQSEDEGPYRMQYVRVLPDGSISTIHYAGLCAGDEVDILYTVVK